MFQTNVECAFCEPGDLNALYPVKNYVADPSSPKKRSFQVRINHTLYYKYSSSQNYHYTKEINEILGNVRSPSNIRFNDLFCLDDEDEYLKRIYEVTEYDGKVQLLSEFYKFHKDLPRWTISKHILKILNYYYDKKRKLEYYKIQRMIENENKNNPNQPAKGIVGDRPIESCSTPVSDSSETLNVNHNVDNILHEVSIYRPQKSLSLIKFTPPSKFSSMFGGEMFPKVFIPPLPLQGTINGRVSTDMQQMVSMLSINTGRSRIELETDMPPQTGKELRLLQPPKVTTFDIAFTQASNQTNKNTPRQQTQTTHVANNTKVGGVFAKKKTMQKKSLKLDEGLLSLSSRNEEKQPQSARYQPAKLLESLSMRNMLRPKGSQTTSRERSKKDTPRDLVKQLKTTIRIPAKTPSLPKTAESKPKLILKESTFKATIAPLSSKNSNKKTFHQLLMPTEMKKLEMKVLQGLQDLQRRNQPAKLASFDQKSLHQILASYQNKVSQKQKGCLSSRQFDSFRQPLI